MPRIQLRELSVLNYAHGTTHWNLRTPFTPEAMASPDFWSDSPGMFSPGDWIFTTHTYGGSSIWVATFGTHPLLVMFFDWSSGKTEI